MNEWGIPGWSQESAYGDFRRWNKNRWRWEFTRRREDYRKDFGDHVEATLAAESRGRVLRPDEPGFFVVADWTVTLQKYGLSLLPNPRISDQPWQILMFRSLHRVGVVRGHGEYVWDDDVGSARIPEGIAAVKFDLSRPIEPQWEAMRETVLQCQKERHGRIKQSRKHPTKWFRYLRVLDARDAGASWKDIADLVIPKSENMTKTPQSARQVWLQARDLMFNWPN